MKTITSLTNAVLTNAVNTPQTAIHSANLRSRRAAHSDNLWTRALLFGGLLGLSSGLLTPAHAQTQTVSRKVDFHTTNQSLWSPTPNGPMLYSGTTSSLPGGLTFAANYAISSTGASFTSALTTSSWGVDNWGKSVYPVSGTGAEVNVSASGMAGINLSAWANSGSVDVDYNGYIVLFPPTNLKPGQAFSIPSQWSGQGTMATHSPQVGVKIQGSLSASADASFKAKAAGSTFLNKSAHGAVDRTVDILTLDNNSLSGSIDVKGLGILTGSGHVPMINTQGNGTHYYDIMGHIVTTPISSSGSDTFLTLDGDITALMTTLLEEAGIEVPPLKSEATVSVNKAGTTWATATAGYNFLDLYGELSLTGQQNFTFAATPTVTLTFWWGGQPQMSASFPAGTTYTGTLPVSATGSVSVVATADVAANKFTNKTSLILNPGLYFLPMEAYVNGSVVGIKSFNLDYTPVATMDLISQKFPISLFNKTFTLGGFTPQALPGFTMNISN